MPADPSRASRRWPGRPTPSTASGAARARATASSSCPAGIAADSAGNVYVADTGNDRIQKFSSTGHVPRQVGNHRNWRRPVQVARGVAADLGQRLRRRHAATTGSRSSAPRARSSPSGGPTGSGDGQFNHPERRRATDSARQTSTSPTPANNRIQKFAPTAASSAKWGTPARGNGQFNDPVAASPPTPPATSTSPTPATTGSRSSTRPAPSIAEWGTAARATASSTPEGVATDSAGNVYVADTDNNRIQKFGSTGTFLTKWGTPAPATASSAIPGRGHRRRRQRLRRRHRQPPDPEVQADPVRATRSDRSPASTTAT